MICQRAPSAGNHASSSSPPATISDPSAQGQAAFARSASRPARGAATAIAAGQGEIINPISATLRPAAVRWNGIET